MPICIPTPSCILTYIHTNTTTTIYIYMASCPVYGIKTKHMYVYIPLCVCSGTCVRHVVLKLSICIHVHIWRVLYNRSGGMLLGMLAGPRARWPARSSPRASVSRAHGTRHSPGSPSTTTPAAEQGARWRRRQRRRPPRRGRAPPPPPSTRSSPSSSSTTEASTRPSAGLQRRASRRLPRSCL